MRKRARSRRTPICGIALLSIFFVFPGYLGVLVPYGRAIIQLQIGTEPTSVGRSQPELWPREKRPFTAPVPL